MRTFLTFILATIAVGCFARDQSVLANTCCLSRTEFHKAIDACTALIAKKEPFSVDDATIIVRVDNTLYMHPPDPEMEKESEAFSKLIHGREVALRLIQALGEWIPNHGMGIYFKKVDLEWGGASDNIRERDAYDVVVTDWKTPPKQ
jgi:hypothetical protein